MKVTLRPTTPDDVSKRMRDPESAEFFRRTPPYFVSAGVPPMSWTICDEAGQDVGLSILHDFDQLSKKVAFGIMIDRAHRSGTTILSAVQELIGDYVFGYLGYNKVYCQTLAHRASLHSRLEELGFTREATLPENCFWQGKYWDEVQHYITAAQWYSKKENVVCPGFQQSQR